ncbi:MAG TPA: glycoside hydrolase family 57 protein [Burkholderiales bacterium]|nr:glycoside hydrolase family 57 protein [Burkholderiales bacterium]
MATTSLKLVLCWHMHQPDYRNYLDDTYVLPWTYLHAIKDYSDMAWHLEQHPDMRCVVNFAPVLLDQLEDYVFQFDIGPLRDPLLALLGKPDEALIEEEAVERILQFCFRNNHAHMLEPFPAYRRLYELYRLVQEDGAGFGYFGPHFYADLVTWYHLSWTGESLRRTVPLISKLMEKASGYTEADRNALLMCIGDTIRGLIGRYRKLAERGQIELSANPQQHPILPLLIDFKVARENTPDMQLPNAESYPGGEARAVWHVKEAIEKHKRRFGKKPNGMWPSEGGVSMAVLDLFENQELQWTASSEAVLAASIHLKGESLENKAAWLYRPYKFSTPQERICCFFRDERLSDLIGFEYAQWFARDAVQHFLHQLEQIAGAVDEGGVVSVILDGENAWETYPYNGYYFLSQLYDALDTSDRIATSIFSECLESAGKLEKLVAGSWVYGTFSTWMGSAEKNLAWDLLCEGKLAVDETLASKRLDAIQVAALMRQLANCEGSDWFWWFGDYNNPESVRLFDRVFRDNLIRLYEIMDVVPPPRLNVPLCTGGQSEGSGTMRRVT